MIESFRTTGLVPLAISDGASTPAPGGTQSAFAWSTTLGCPVWWNGSVWRALGEFANYYTTTDYSITNTAYTSINAAVRLTGLAPGRYLTLCTAQILSGNSNVDSWLGLHAGAAGSTTLCTGAESPTRTSQSITLYPKYDYELPITVFGSCDLTAGQIIEPKVKSASGSVDVLNLTMSAWRLR